jgi:hypothetical protein
MSTIIPKVFISYSHDSLEHKKWILELATRLRNNGIDAIIDQFELMPGDDVPHFMETHLANANKILMICSEKYVEKANAGKGGVGYEKMIITSNLMKQIDENKIIPIIKQTASTEVPTFLKSKLYINFSKVDDYEFSYDDLVRAIHNSPLFKKPPVGNNPFKPIEKEKLNSDIDFINKVLVGIISELDRYNPAYVSDVANRLNSSQALVTVGIIKLINLGYANGGISNKRVSITEKGFLYAYENNMLS